MNTYRLTQLAVISVVAYLCSTTTILAQNTIRKPVVAKDVSRKSGEPTPAKRPAAPPVAAQPTATQPVATQPVAAQPVSVKSEVKTESVKESVMLLPAKSKSPKDSAATNASSELYNLVYKLKKDEKIVSEVTHLATTNTKINEVTQASQSRTVSRKVWNVTGVESSGNMTFTHAIEAVDMSQQVGDEAEVRYNSKTDKEPPSAFVSVADTIGKPLATITITPWGEVVDRSEKAKGANLGMGDITIPMPQEAIEIGQQWETAREIRVRRTDGSPKIVKVRELYTLEKVSAGVAVISIRSEPLTPLHEPELEAQAIQQMSNGEVRFDLDAGRLISKSLAWDKSVVGFSGAGSVMDYSARLDEKVQ